VTRYQAPGGPGIRVDSHLTTGYTIPPWYDSLLAKVIAWGPDRPTAVARLAGALGEMVIEGLPTTLPLLRWLVDSPAFRHGGVDTAWLQRGA